MEISFPRNTIYGLVDPRTGEVRYAGRSSIGIAEPMRYIVRARKKPSKGDRHVHHALRKMMREGVEPEVWVLEELPDVMEDLNTALNEQETLAVAFYRERGDRLTNQTDGGGGTKGYRHTPEAKEKLSRNTNFRNPINRGRKHPPDEIER